MLLGARTPLWTELARDLGCKLLVRIILKSSPTQFVEKLSFRNQCHKGWGPLLLGRLLSREGISVYVSVLFLGTPVFGEHSPCLWPQYSCGAPMPVSLMKLKGIQGKGGMLIALRSPSSARTRSCIEKKEHNAILRNNNNEKTPKEFYHVLTYSCYFLALAKCRC